MNEKNRRRPVIGSGLCRCCGNMKKCRLLDVEYDHMGKKEIYTDMMMDCFGLLLSNMDGEVTDRLVCAKCVWQLRAALEFKQQVLKCEEAFLQNLHMDVDAVKIEIDVKNEENEKDDLVNNYDDGLDCSHGIVQDYPSSDDDNSKDDRKLSDLKKSIDQKNINKQQSIPTQLLTRDQTSLKKNINNTEHMRLQRELLSRMKKTKLMLKQKLNKKEAVKAVSSNKERQLKTESVPKRVCNERMIHHNTVTVVENSYICPFKNRISNYYCYYCKEIFTDCNELRNHTLDHNPKMFENLMECKRVPKVDITRIDCRLCPEKINDIQTFKNHITTIHKKKLYPNISNEFLQFRLSMESMSCLECGESFIFIDKLIDHMTDHFGKFVCDVCGACFIEEASLCHHIRCHKKVDTDFPCDVCGKNLKSNYGRTLHIATVHEKRPVVHCYKCEASFLSYAQRNRHLINVHGDRRKFPCKLCDKIFDVRKTMVEHMRKYHLQVCRHQCDICEQRFYAPSQLKEHKASHTGERNFRCEYCDKSYPRRQSLQDHLRSHTNDRRYKCDVCSSTFTQSVTLRNHIKTHHQSFEMAHVFNT